jgi:hypothetical protein
VGTRAEGEVLCEDGRERRALASGCALPDIVHILIVAKDLLGGWIRLELRGLFQLGHLDAMDEPAVNELLCQKLGMDFVPIIFTASGGMGDQRHLVVDYGTHTTGIGGGGGQADEGR